MTRPTATDWLALRIPPAEKQQLREEARSAGVSMSVLVRINNMAAREQRKRQAELETIYPQS